MASCTLCDLPTGDDPIVGPDGEGPYCCRGCRAVDQELGDPPAADAPAPEPPASDPPENAETAYLSVSGMHCASCETFLESLGDREAGVVDADASYAAGALRVRYDPDTTDADALAETFSRWGYDARDRSVGDDRDQDDAVGRLLVGAGFGMMAMLWYVLFLYPGYLGLDPIVSFGTFDGLYLYGQLWVFASVVLFYTGAPILRGALVSLRARQPNVDLLVSIAAVAAYCYSAGTVLTGGDHLYFDVSIVVVLAVSVGSYYEGRIRRRAAGAIADLADLQVGEATRAADGETVVVDAVSEGDELLVRAGERIPVDGTVVSGTASVDRSLVTGEARPETVDPGDTVQGGTVVTDGHLTVAAGPGATSTLDRLVDLLWDVQSTRPGPQRLADRLATVFVPLVLVVAGVAVTWSLWTGATPRSALLTGLGVLVVSCPCALGLATPLAVASGLTAAVERGVVIGTPALFETGTDVDTVVLDKTGTLTDGGMTVQETVAHEADDETVRRRASAVESLSTHPVAAAVADAGDGTPATVTDFESDRRGVSGDVDGDRVVVGHPDYLREQGLAVPAPVADSVATARADGQVPVLVGWDGRAHGCLVVGDSPRADWERVVESLGADARVVVLTGDDSGAVARFEAHPAVDDVYAGVPPDGKEATVRRLAAAGTVAMVGDGSNDAPALAAADVGIALSGGTQLAGDAADAVVTDLADVPAVFDIAAATRRRIRGNLGWAFLYNVVAIPLAALGLINPLLAAIAMASSSLLVVANSARSLDGADTPPERVTALAQSETDAEGRSPSYPSGT